MYGHHQRFGMHMNHEMCHCRRFLSKEEKIEHLEHYKKCLESELKGLNEAIEELKKE